MSGARRYRLLGGVAATVDGEPVDLGGPKQRAVLAVLALDAGRIVPVERLVAVVWGDRVPDRAEVSLRSYVSNLRRALGGSDAIVSRRPGYLLDAGADDLDVTRFEALVATGQALLRRSDHAGAAAALDHALALWTGPPLADLAGELPLLDLVARLDERRAEAIEARFEARLGLGEHDAAVADLTAAVAAAPLREGLRAQLALALYRSGRQADALRAIDDARRTLAEEIGVEPGPELKALEQQILAHDPALDWAPPAPVASDAPLPTDLFVGRDDELAALVDAARAAIAGRGRAVVVSGEPGIGKTRLVEALAARATDLGAVVAWARCPESAAAAPHWPWLQVADQLDAAGLGTALAGALRPSASTGDHAVDQVRLQADAVAALGSTGRPIVVVIDDLQWADAASLQLLEYAAGELHHRAVLVAVTTRPPTAEDPPALVSCLGELARSRGSVRVALTGLGVDDIGAWLDATAADPRLAAFVHDRTGGNPFFVREIVALLDTDAADTIPAAVQDVVRRRAAHLPDPTQQVLPVAAVIGRRFDVDVLAAVTATGTDAVLDALEAAVDAGLVAVDPTRPGRIAFSHAIVADTLASSVNAVRRARVHAATARALHDLRGADPDSVVEEVAHHAFAGAAAGSAALAVRASMRAADLAVAALAYADAVAHLEHAVAAHELADPDDLGARHRMLHRLGVLRAWAGDVRGARTALADAATVAEQAGDVEAMVLSLAFVNVDDFWSSNDWQQHDPRTIGLLERALERLDPADHERVAAVESALALQLYHAAPTERIESLAEHAIAVGLEHGPLHLQVRTLFQGFWSMWRPATNARRTELARQLVERAEHIHDAMLDRVHTLAHLATFVCAAESGDGPAADAALARAEEAAGVLRAPELHGQILWSHIFLYFARGRFAETVPLAEEMWEAFWRSRRFAAEATRGAVVGHAYAELGRVDDAVAAAAAFGGTPFEGPSRWQSARVLAEAGRLEEAAAHLAAFDGRTMRDDWYRPTVVLAGLHAAVDLGERGLAAALADLLGPAAGLWSINGSGGPTSGPVDLGLARAAHLLGDDERAATLVASSLAACDRLGGEPWRARTLLLRHRLHGDGADLAEARAIAERLGMAALVAAIARV